MTTGAAGPEIAPGFNDLRLPMRVASLYTSIFSPFIEFVYPTVCLACQVPLSEDERMVCAQCWGRIHPLQEGDEEFQAMAERLRASGCIDGLVACHLFEKEGVLQSLMHELKYGGMSTIGVDLGKHLGVRITELLPDESIAGLVPVPLHRVKMRERGYNQSECICRGIARVTGLPVLSSLLQRTKYTKTQTQLSLTEREENVKNAFAVCRGQETSIEQAGFLLVDDVITTGATIISSARALAAHGAKNIYACSVALACKTELS
jgi:ComF family protein